MLIIFCLHDCRRHRYACCHRHRCRMNANLQMMNRLSESCCGSIRCCNSMSCYCGSMIRFVCCYRCSYCRDSYSLVCLDSGCSAAWMSAFVNLELGCSIVPCPEPDSPVSGSRSHCWKLIPAYCSPSHCRILHCPDGDCLL